MENEVIENEVSSLKGLSETTQREKKVELYEKILNHFASGNADLTLDEVIEKSRIALGMRAPDGQRHM